MKTLVFSIGKMDFQYWKNGFSVLSIFGTFTHELINYTTIEGIDQLHYFLRDRSLMRLLKGLISYTTIEGIMKELINYTTNEVIDQLYSSP